MSQPPASGPPEAGPGGSPEPGPQCYRHPGRETWIRCQRCDRPICPDCMNDAAVGFQCGECVKSGQRETRQGVATYGGSRSRNPALTSMALIGINVAVFLAVLGTGGATSRLVEMFALTPDGLCWLPGRGGFEVGAGVCQHAGGNFIDGVAEGAWWQLLTSAFMHVQIWHIAFNMLALWVLGPQLEAVFGRVRFLALYLISALAGSAVVMWLSDQYSATLGASGAIFGLMGALLVVALKMKGDVSQILLWLGINAAITIFGRDAISWQGHLGGLLGGMLVAAIIVFAPRARRAPVQWAGMALTLVVVLAAIGARIAQLS